MGHEKCNTFLASLAGSHFVIVLFVMAMHGQMLLMALMAGSAEELKYRQWFHSLTNLELP